MKPREALLLLLDQVDYTAGNCQMNEPVGGVLPQEVIKLCRNAAQLPLAPDACAVCGDPLYRNYCINDGCANYIHTRR